ncbi:aromatic ring-hydroxylating dioxygenase subunit alpha [Paenibacillus kobensis]|uniref:aromatic ring-hydroxylating dioxygenase subunit alpha n=1 Tax=Paenibacillus kobensis TaxID=59841 RepID=UPI000FD79A5B|nr:aromatic ring-hydroxylating dioxygenase subunit alpha [Paenibacillus kobensis]
MRFDPALRDEWHPAARSEQVAEKPVSVTVLGESVVLFRSSEGVRALRDLCIHRGVPLSLGTVREGELVCAYHGWRYDGEGRCVCIPALPAGQTIPPKARTETYACTELYGLIWVCLFDPRTLLPPIAGRIDDTYLSIRMGPYPVKAAAPRVIENFLDISHLMFVHEGLLGDPAHAEINDYAVHAAGECLRTDEIIVYQPDPDGRGIGVHNRYIYEIFSPLCVKLFKQPAETEERFHLFLVVLPETETTCSAFMLQYRNYAADVPDEVFIDFQSRLLEQDKRIVEAQRPELLPLDLQAELHLRCDRLSMAYRRMLRERGVTIGTA